MKAELGFSSSELSASTNVDTVSGGQVPYNKGMEGTTKSFPKGFLWGTATSAHQVEGGNRNDWTEWERENAERLAHEAKRNWPPRQQERFPEMFEPENYISGRAVDHYNRYEEDFYLMQELGINAYRFSIEWSRIEPEEGKCNEIEIEHYRKVMHALRARGIEPFVTLWHWTNPLWIRDIGGWENPKTIEYFGRYAERVAAAFPSVRFFTTLNEPEAFARHGYILKDRPPAHGNACKAYRVLRHLSEGHKEAARVLKKRNSKAEVGFTESLVHFEPFNRWPHNMWATEVVRWWRNNPLFEKFVSDSDFIGLQYYFHSRIRLNPFVSRWGVQFNENKEVSDLGWEIYPEGMYHVLKSLTQYGKPIYVTENGVADADDRLRAGFIEKHVYNVRRAMREGTDVRGYFYWSLMDNFEWSEGFWPRFGLVGIDYQNNLKRRVRPSAYEYAKIIKANTIK